MSRHPRLDSAIVLTEKGLEVVPAVEAARRMKLETRAHMAKTLEELLSKPSGMKERHAEHLHEKLTADPIAVVVREFGPGCEVA